jgi:predicted O-methyltransferase YrrM
MRRYPGAVLTAARRTVRTYREAVAFRRADQRFAPALAPALSIEGFTRPIELSLLYHLALLGQGPGEVVEIGSYLGRSTVVLAQAVADAGMGQVVAVDPHTGALGIGPPRATDQEFRRNIARCGLDQHVKLVHATSVDAAKQWRGGSVRMLFVDGWHSYEAVIEDVIAWAPFLTPAATVVFDDYPHPAVRAAIQRLNADDVIGGAQLIVGKMIAFGPKPLVSAVPSPPGAAMLARLGDLGFALAFRWKRNTVPDEMKQYE